MDNIFLKNNRWKKEDNRNNKNNNKNNKNNKNNFPDREERENKKHFNTSKNEVSNNKMPDNKIDDDNFPVLSVEKKDHPVEKKEESKWKKAIMQQNKKDREKINVNDPKYWRGYIWIGPIYLKQNKNSEKWNNYIKKAQESGASSILFPNNKRQYSRDDVNWYNSYEDTFTEEHLEKMNYQKMEEENQKFQENLERQLTILYEKRREESEYYYEITGELDGFALAELEREEYEKYAKQFEIEEEPEPEKNIENINSEEEYENDY